LWAVPPAAFLAGAALVLAMLRRVDSAAAEASDELERLAPLRSAVHGLNADTDRAQAAREALHDR
jgi:cytochrome c-type biogenesis protein CcmH/NrfF